MNNIKSKSALMVAAALMLLVSACVTNQSTQIERITPEQLAKIMPQPVANVSLDEVVTLSQQGISADGIIKKINDSGSRYELTPSQTLELSKKGVDAKVLDYIHSSNEKAKQNAIADEINKREKAKTEAQQQLRRQQEIDRRTYDGFYDPFWPGYGYPYGFGPYGFGPYGYAPYGYSIYWRGGRRMHR